MADLLFIVETETGAGGPAAIATTYARAERIAERLSALGDQDFIVTEIEDGEIFHEWRGRVLKWVSGAPKKGESVVPLRGVK